MTDIFARACDGAEPCASGETEARDLVLSRSLRALVHPVTIGAVVLLLINDFVLRQQWPSWWTGKLGDFAWLAFAPLLIAPFLSLLIPRRVRRKGGWVIGISIGVVALGFAAVKAIPGVFTVYHSLLRSWMPVASTLRFDPSDLIALPAVWVALWVWRSRRISQVGMGRRAWMVLTVGALATVANSGIPNYGVASFEVVGDAIVAPLAYDYYVSTDGGLTWELEEGNLDVWQDQVHGDAWNMDTPDGLYRFEPGIQILRSIDGGETWLTEVSLAGTDARSAYARKFGPQYVVSGPGPLDAVFDSATGNLVVAMGVDGVLVRPADGDWRWVAVGEYRRSDIQTVGQAGMLLGGELWLAFVLVFLVFGVVTWPVRRRIWLSIVLVLSWIGWLFVVWGVPPAQTWGYSSAAVPFLIIAVGVLGLAAAIGRAVDVGRIRPGSLWVYGVISLLIAVLSVVPYALWAAGVIARYRVSSVIAMVLVVVCTATATVLLRRSKAESPSES